MLFSIYFQLIYKGVKSLATKLQLITELSERTTQKLTGTYENWTAFLRTASWNYKYSFAEQVLIHAQRPDATACAPIEL